MARSKKPDVPPVESQLKLPASEAAAKIKDRIEKGLQLRMRAPQSATDVDSFDSDYKKWDSYNNEFLKRLFTTETYAEEYSWWGVTAVHGHRLSPQERVADLYKETDERVRRLESILERLELIPLAPGVARVAAGESRAHTNKVFVVHGVLPRWAGRDAGWIGTDLRDSHAAENTAHRESAKPAVHLKLRLIG